jgi:hypothetical protein
MAETNVTPFWSLRNLGAMGRNPLVVTDERDLTEEV